MTFSKAGGFPRGSKSQQGKALPAVCRALLQSLRPYAASRNHLRSLSVNRTAGPLGHWPQTGNINLVSPFKEHFLQVFSHAFFTCFIYYGHWENITDECVSWKAQRTQKEKLWEMLQWHGARLLHGESCWQPGEMLHWPHIEESHFHLPWLTKEHNLSPATSVPCKDNLSVFKYKKPQANNLSLSNTRNVNYRLRGYGFISTRHLDADPCF